jgi:hypothetical protein
MAQGPVCRPMGVPTPARPPPNPTTPDPATPDPATPDPTHPEGSSPGHPAPGRSPPPPPASRPSGARARPRPPVPARYRQARLARTRRSRMASAWSSQRRSIRPAPRWPPPRAAQPLPRRNVRGTTRRTPAASRGRTRAAPPPPVMGFLLVMARSPRPATVPPATPMAPDIQDHRRSGRRSRLRRGTPTQARSTARTGIAPVPVIVRLQGTPVPGMAPLGIAPPARPTHRTSLAHRT